MPRWCSSRYHSASASTPRICARFASSPVRIRHLRRNEADDERRAAARQDRSVPVVNHAARRGYRNQPNLIGLRRRAIALPIDELHDDQAREQHRQCDDDERGERYEPPRGEPPRRAARRIDRSHQRARSKRRPSNIATTITAALSTLARTASWRCMSPESGRIAAECRHDPIEQRAHERRRRP